MVKKVMLILLAVLHFTQAVQFSFNRADVAISEGGDLSSQISIVKSGENNETISFQVRVISDTARENQDYISNSETPYVFTSNTSQLPIRTQLVGDRAGEPIETFMICLPDAQVLQSMGAQAVQPTCVTITIVDDDSVVIGFKNSREGVVEGGTTMVCAVVKPEGLRLDPFDRVPLNIRTNPASSEVQLNTNSLVFEQSINERCVMVTVQNGDLMDMGNRSYTLILERSNEMSTVPVEIYPNIIPIIVIDDDAQESDISFTIISQESPVRVLEGSRVGGIEVQKLGSTVLTYNVTLTSSTRSNDFVVTSPLKFDPTTTRMNVGVDIMEDSISETRKEFSISIDRIMVIGAQGATNLATATGEPVTIIAYDNDIEINFTSKEFSVPEDSSNKNVCVEITKPVASSDIEPSLAIPITVTLENSVPNNLLLDQRKILLNATNKMACLTVSHTANNSSTRRYTIQLMWTDDQAGYNVYLPRQNATIIIITNTSSGSEQSGSLTSGAIAGIIIGVFLSLIIGVSAIVIPFIVVHVRRKKHKKMENKEEHDDDKFDPPTSKTLNSGTTIPCVQNPSYIQSTENRETELNEASYESIPGGTQEPETNPQQQPNPQQPNRPHDNSPVDGETPPRPSDIPDPSNQPTQPHKEEPNKAADKSSEKSIQSEAE